MPDAFPNPQTRLPMNREHTQFILENSSPEDPLLEELYRQTHIQFVNPNMVTGHPHGRFLEMIARMIKPDNILEIGTFTGYSAICLAKGLKSGGQLITIESNDELISFAGKYFHKAGLDKKIIQISGRAQDIIPGLDRDFDLVFIDGDKREYCEYYRLALDKLKKGGFIIADNVLWGGKALEKDSNDAQTKGIIEFNEMIRKDHNSQRIMLPLRDGITIIQKP
jgi:caffeoyl-CoA O-methyltransferase